MENPPLPFGQTLFLWRFARGLTQAELAKAAGIPRPNLSEIEQGRREVTLGTLRSLALALRVRPGVLVDGIPPPLFRGTQRWSRRQLERIAHAACRDTRLSSGPERKISELLRQVAGFQGMASGKRRMKISWLLLKSTCPPHVVKSLIQRVRDRERLHDKTAD